MPKDLNQLLQPVPDNIRQMRIGTDEATGLGIHRGDLILIDTTLQPMFGDIVVASIAGRWPIDTLVGQKSPPVDLSCKDLFTAARARSSTADGTEFFFFSRTFKPFKSAFCQFSIESGIPSWR